VVVHRPTVRRVIVGSKPTGRSGIYYRFPLAATPLRL
jgi:hypothetical protein